MFDGYGRPTGYGQMAPGRDVPQPKKRQQEAQPDITAAIGAGMPVGGTDTPFQGAKQTVQPVAKTPGLTGGIPEPGGFAGPAAQGPVSAGAPAPSSTFRTQLMEGDTAKLGNTEHMAKSPKYDFLTLAQSNKYNYTQMPEMLKELQGGPNGRLWQGWTADGKGNFVFQGDPSQLAPEWGGVKRVDAVGSFGNLANGGQAAGWRWGADDPNAALGGAQLGPAILGTVQPTVDGDANYGGVNMREQIMKALQLDPRFAGMAKQYGF